MVTLGSRVGAVVWPTAPYAIPHPSRFDAIVKGSSYCTSWNGHAVGSGKGPFGCDVPHALARPRPPASCSPYGTVCTAPISASGLSTHSFTKGTVFGFV